MKLKKLGVVDELNLDIKDMTIFIGPNNSGKTYVSYFLYGIISYILSNDIIVFEEEIKRGNKFSVTIEDLKKELVKKIKTGIEENKAQILIDNFKTSKDGFKKFSQDITENEIEFILGELKFNSELENDSIFSGIEEFFTLKLIDGVVSISFENQFPAGPEDFLNRMFSSFIKEKLLDLPRVFYVPAERAGINVFRTELDITRANTFSLLTQAVQLANLQDTKKEKNSKFELLNNSMNLISDRSLYPKPISDYISYLNKMNASNLKFGTDSLANYMREELLHGKFELDKETNKATFIPQHGNRQGKAIYKKNIKIPFHVLSSSIKSLYGLDYYLDNLGNKNDIIIIDEPELSLHVENQLKMARFLVKMVDYGYKVIISTHSDIIIRALTNSLLENKLKKTGLQSDRVGVYDFNCKIISEGNDLTKIYNFSNFDDVSYALEETYENLLLEISENE